jgi:hypothetical protein
METETQKLMRFLTRFVILIIAARFVFGSDMFKAKDIQGDGYFHTIIPGWVKLKPKKAKVLPDPGLFVLNKSTEIAYLVWPETDETTGQYTAAIMSMSARMDAPNWIEDMFPEIKRAIQGSGGKVIDEGELKLDTQIAKWIFFQDQMTKYYNLEFYATDEGSRIYKLRYTATPKLFNKLRPDFETTRESFRFKFGI